MAPSIALASGSWILAGVALLIVAGVVYGFYTRSGSGIEQHRLDVGRETPGAEGRSVTSGGDEGEGAAFDTQGTR